MCPKRHVTDVANTVQNNFKQTKNNSVSNNRGWDKLWYMHTFEYYIAIKVNN